MFSFPKCSPTKSQTHLYGAYPKIVAILDPGLWTVASHLRGILCCILGVTTILDQSPIPVYIHATLL